MIERDGTGLPTASDGQRYFTLTHAGRKDECRPYPFMLVAPAEGVEQAQDAAWALFEKELAFEKYTHPDSLLEWRARPKLQLFAAEDDCVAMVVRARLAFVDAA